MHPTHFCLFDRQCLRDWWVYGAPIQLRIRERTLFWNLWPFALWGWWVWRNAVPSEELFREQIRSFDNRLMEK